MELFGLLLDRLWAAFWLPLAGFGLHWAHHGPPWLPFWTFRTPSRAFSAPWPDFGGVFAHPGPPLGPLLASFGCFWAPLGLFLNPLGPYSGRPTVELIGFVLVRLSPDECLRTPVESKRILRKLLVIIGVYRHLMFSKVSDSRLPQQAESKKQGGRRCVARRASSIMEGYEHQFRQRIAAEIKGRGQEFSGEI